MSGAMTIQEVRQRREDVQKQIGALLLEFWKETGLMPVGVAISAVANELVNGRETQPLSVLVDIAIDFGP